MKFYKLKSNKERNMYFPQINFIERIYYTLQIFKDSSKLRMRSIKLYCLKKYEMNIVSKMKSTIYSKIIH